MRTAVFLACALGATPVAATASGTPLANLVLTLTRDVLDAAFNGDGASLSLAAPSTAASRVRRRLQDTPVPQPSDDTIQKIQNAADAAALKLAGDGADCASIFAPLNNGGETADMRANQDKLEESMKHFPFGGFVSYAEWADQPRTCTCDTGFTVDQYAETCQCDAFQQSGDGSSCPNSDTCTEYWDSVYGSTTYTCDQAPCPCASYTSNSCADVPMPTDALLNIAEAGASLRFNKDGADSDIVMYLYDLGDDYSDNCPTDWNFDGCKDFNIKAVTTSKKDSAAPGVPEDDVTGTSTMSAQVPVCAPQACFDNLSDMVGDLNEFIKAVTTALNGDPAISAKLEFGDITVDAGFCWPRWYNMIFMFFGTMLCLACSVVAAKNTVFKKSEGQPLMPAGGGGGDFTTGGR